MEHRSLLHPDPNFFQQVVRTSHNQCFIALAPSKLGHPNEAFEYQKQRIATLIKWA
jgi:hypothetical protein